MPPPSARQKFDELRPDVLGPCIALRLQGRLSIVLAIANANRDVTARTLPHSHAERAVPPTTSTPTVADGGSSKAGSETTQTQALCEL